MRVSLCAFLVMSSCKPDDAVQTIGDIQAVVDQAGMAISILQSNAPSDLPNDLPKRREALDALMFAKASSRAAWLAASESNSKDSLSQRNAKITGYFSEVPVVPLDHLTDPGIKAGEEQLTGSIQLLLGHLESNRVAIAAHPGTGDLAAESNSETFTRHLSEIRQKAIDNIAAADSLIKRLQP